ncbi:MAG: O-methyltransferase [Candidatus Neomarinimicrobiota bacterium]
MQLVSQEIDNYCKEHSLGDTELLSQLYLDTLQHEEAPQMLSGSLIGGLLQLLIKISNAEKILEIGMFTGYSALKMAEALPDSGSIDCCEINDAHIITAKKWFDQSENGHKIKVHKGQAIDSMKKFYPENYDLIFIDADKINYPEYHKIGLSLLKLGGIGVFDNMLWSGTVLNPNDNDSRALRETAKLIINSNRLEPLLLPIRDGVMIYRKIK